MITIIVAMTRSGVIGRHGALPWHISDDLRHFKQTTAGGAVVMGRKTFESIGKPLPGRRTIVVSRTMGGREGLRVCRTFDEAMDAARAGGREAFVAGGGEIYRQALPVADRMLVSYVCGEYEGDTVFPDVDWTDWRVESKRDHAEFELVTYRRVDEGAAA